MVSTKPSSRGNKSEPNFSRGFLLPILWTVFKLSTTFSNQQKYSDMARPDPFSDFVSSKPCRANHPSAELCPFAPFAASLDYTCKLSYSYMQSAPKPSNTYRLSSLKFKPLGWMGGKLFKNVLPAFSLNNITAAVYGCCRPVGSQPAFCTLLYAQRYTRLVSCCLS